MTPPISLRHAVSAAVERSELGGTCLILTEEPYAAIHAVVRALGDREDVEAVRDMQGAELCLFVGNLGCITISSDLAGDTPVHHTHTVKMRVQHG